MVFITESAGYVVPKTSNTMGLPFSTEIERLSDADSSFYAGSLGHFLLAGFQIKLQRYSASYVVSYYIPTGLLVIMSWMSFLILEESSSCCISIQNYKYYKNYQNQQKTWPKSKIQKPKSMSLNG